MRLRFSGRANSDLADIAAYLNDRSPQAAQKIEMQLIAVFQLLASHPHAGRRVGRDVRRFPVPRLPYLIYYRINVDGDALEVITVRHGARNPIA